MGLELRVKISCLAENEKFGSQFAVECLDFGTGAHINYIGTPKLYSNAS